MGAYFSTIFGFNSGGINKDKEGVTTELEKEQNSSENLEADVKEKNNELPYEVSSEKKTVPAEIHSLSSLGKEIKVSENFEVIEEDPNGLYFSKQLYYLQFFYF
ncbi:hypothetical protein [Niallia sp. FSL W8-0635]|uniref:hypothetical protein n=1 Tax=Niallia sp. FSL W8-0635 TaxID=2975337 RepID=UPI0030FC0C77